MRFKVVVWHGEMHSFFYIMDTQEDCLIHERPFMTRVHADSWCATFNRWA